MFAKLPHKFRVAHRILSKSIYRLIGDLNQRIQPRSIYHIKPGYHHALKAESFDARGSTDEWQKEVYQFAASLMKQQRLRSVLDVGCGSGYKLVHYLGEFDTIGIEVSPTFEWLQRHYPNRRWLNFDGMAGQLLQTDLLICSDVIEHIEEPDSFMTLLASLPALIYVISTPERDEVAGKSDYGPPQNTAHFREWNETEFRHYVSRWFEVLEQRIFRGSRATAVTQVIVARSKGGLITLGYNV